MAEPGQSDHVIPVIEEQAFVSKRSVDTEHVRVRTSAEDVSVMVREEVERQHVEIRHVPIDRQVAQAPTVREENGVTIIPVIEERLIVEKRLFLVEEIHVTRVTMIEAVELPTTLRRTRVEIDRTSVSNHQEDIDGRTR